MAKKGVLIAIEGIDGSGKTTQSEMLFNSLRLLSLPAILLHEPTTGYYGRIIREKLAKEHINPEEAYFLFVMDRREHVRQKILPALKDGKIVIIDRYFISTIAYQGAGGISIERIISDHRTFAPIPDLIIILDISIDTALRRLKAKRNRDMFEKNKDFLERVRNIYLRIKNLLSTKVIVINAEKDPKEIHIEILKHVCRLLKERGFLEDDEICLRKR